jgi:hypothetical protein
MGRVFDDRCQDKGISQMNRDLEGLKILSAHLTWHGICRLSGLLAYLQSNRHLSEFGLSGKYIIIHARCPQSQFHFSSRVPGLAGHLTMPSVDTLSPVISVLPSCFALRL